VSVGAGGRKIAIILLIVFLSRTPFLSAGFGSDDDAWRVAVAALRLRDTGEYIPSVDRAILCRSIQPRWLCLMELLRSTCLVC